MLELIRSFRGTSRDTTGEKKQKTEKGPNIYTRKVTAVKSTKRGERERETRRRRKLRRRSVVEKRTKIQNNRNTEIVGSRCDLFLLH